MGICGGQGDTRQGFLHGSWLSAVSNIPRMIPTHYFIYHRRCVVLAIEKSDE